MGFWEANAKFWTNYVNFEGRSTRSEFWWPALLHNLIFWGSFIVLIVWMIASIDSAGDSADASYIALGVWFSVFMLYVFATFLPWMSVTVRRFHDQDMSGWMWLINLAAGIVVLVFMCIEGKKGPNRFGDDPREKMSLDIFD